MINSLYIKKTKKCCWINCSARNELPFSSLRNGDNAVISDSQPSNMTSKEKAAGFNRDVEYEYTAVEAVNVPPPGLGIRHLQAFLLFFSLIICYGMKAAMSVAIVAMTSESSSNSDIKIFHWDKKTQDIVMSSFFWGYMAMQLPAGQIAIRYGGKMPVVLALVLNGVTSQLVPLVASWGGWKAVCGVRTVQGLAQGLLMSAINSLLGRWSPVEERARLGAIVHGGAHLGSVIMMTMAGFQSASNYGWPSVYYAQGGMSIVVGIVWFFLGANSPAEHKYISVAEKNYIQTSLGKNITKKVTKVPWKAILTTPAVWALCISHMGQSWGTITLMSQIPAYLSKVMHTNIKESGVLSALPFLGKWISMFLLGFLFDYLTNHKYLSRVNARKTANTIGHWPAALGLIALAYANDIVVAETLLILTCALFSATGLGCMINHMDLSPNYAGTLMSLSNFCANIMSVFAPLTAGFILTDDTDVSLWRKVFLVSASIHFANNLVFMFVGKAEVQPWDDPDFEKDRSDEKDLEIKLSQNGNEIIRLQKLKEKQEDKVEAV